jgi:DNA-binding transcriptional MocR family regulator
MTGPHVSDVELRRLLRPAAWTVWTAVVDHATPDADGVAFAAVSVRRLALELGLAKDTVAGCIQRLAAHGLIERRPQAHVAGRFIAGGYLVYRPEPVIPDVAPPSSLTSSPHSSSTSTTDQSAHDPHRLSPPTPTTPTSTTPTSPRPNSPTSQLSFLSEL